MLFPKGYNSRKHGLFFFFNDTATTEIYTLSLHDALPIWEIVRYSRRDDLRRRIVFIENYDLNVARYLAQGCDVWLNLPRRPLEASGTSGMKAALNGVLHLSVLDGWWAEAYRPGLGWAIGQGEEYADPGYGDLVERS